jgi:hypothetical protein
MAGALDEVVASLRLLTYETLESFAILGRCRRNLGPMSARSRQYRSPPLKHRVCRDPTAYAHPFLVCEVSGGGFAYFFPVSSSNTAAT